MAVQLDVLAFGAHPDDVELGAGGTVAKLIGQGKKVGICDLTRGQLGSRGTVDDRRREAAASARILGVHVRENLGMEDGFFVNDAAHREKIIEIIRHYRPEIVLANVIADRHPDHGRGAALVSDAAYFSGLRAIRTVYNGVEQPHWRPRVVYHYLQDHHHKPDFVVDITDHFSKKMEAVLAFSTQFFDPESDEPETPISSKSFLDFVEARAREMGRNIGVDFGEGFLCARPPGVDDLTILK